MPVLPLVGSMIWVSGVEDALLLGRLDHRPADAVLDAGVRIEEFEFHQHGGVSRRNKSPQLDQRRVERGVDDVGVDLLVRHGYASFHVNSVVSIFRSGETTRAAAIPCSASD